MKKPNRIRLLVVCLSMLLLLPTAVSAALPPSLEVQWVNTKSANCGIVVSTDTATATACIMGYAGTTVQATAVLYEIIDGKSTVIYSASTPENNSMPFASFTYEFVPVSGATYTLFLSGTVSKDGVDEAINRNESVRIA